MAGVALGVVALTVIQSMMGGYRESFVAGTLASSPHITVRRRDPGRRDPAAPARRFFQAASDPLLITAGRPPLPDEQKEIEGAPALRAMIERVPGVIAAAATVSAEVQMGFHGNWEPVTLNGIEEGYGRITNFGGNLKSGSLASLERRRGNLILGHFLAERMRTRVGERVTVRRAGGGSVSLRVAGIYQGGVYDTDNTNAWVSLREAQSILGLGSRVNLIQVRTAHQDQAGDMAGRIEAATGLDAESWMEASNNTLQLLTMFSAIMTLVTIFTMAVAGFGIAGNLITTVAEKSFDIGVLKATGLSSVRISLIFLLLALMIAFIGTLAGLGASWWIIDTMSGIKTQIKPGPGVLVYTDTMPMLKSRAPYITAALFAFLVSIIAGISPALRAARLEPLQIIRNAA